MNSLWFRTGGIALCVPPKCGGTAIYRRVFDVPDEIDDRSVFSHVHAQAGFVTSYAVEGDAVKILAVRDPVERFMSLWRDKCRNGDENLPYLKGLSPTQLLGCVEQNLLNNSHWAPQSAYFVNGCAVVPYATVLQWFSVKKFSNCTERMDDDPDFPTAELLRLYRPDVEMIYGTDPFHRHF